MLERHLTEFGLAPGLGYLLSALLFTGFSGFLFYKTIYAEYIYLLICLSYLGKLSEWERNNFLKLCFPKTAYRQIRLVENSLLALPFLFFLVMQTCWLSALALVLAAPGMAFLHFEKQRNFQLPTPFFRRPFEFIVGFRSSFWLHFLAYGLGAIALNVGNFNLGLFALAMVFIVCMSYYVYPEPAYFVWIHAQNPGAFLWTKFTTAMLYSGTLAAPLALGLLFAFPDHTWVVLGIVVLGYVCLLAIILAKYAAFPHEMSLPQSILLLSCLWLPPLLLVILPYFYRQSVKRLNQFLS